jgi:hypothetical protein
MDLMDFLKNQILAQNPKRLAFSFTEKLQFAAKTDQYSVFLGRKAPIHDRIRITVCITIFMGFSFFKKI